MGHQIDSVLSAFLEFRYDYWELLESLLDECFNEALTSSRVISDIGLKTSKEATQYQIDLLLEFN